MLTLDKKSKNFVIFYKKNLRISNFCCNFAAILVIKKPKNSEKNFSNSAHGGSFVRRSLGF